jgi:NAD(P)-dependent dehydrogenase (short-subunit alcohol dehydrogenase family)
MATEPILHHAADSKPSSESEGHLLKEDAIPGELENKVCLIVGASGTLGAAVAKSFSQAGARLALGGHATAPAGATPNERTLALQFDIRSWRDVNGALQKVHQHFGALDVLVNCSGNQGPIGPAHTLDPEAWARAVEVNLLGSFYLARAAVPIMLTQGGGKIIYFSGGGATSPRPFFSAYGSSKAAVVRFTETLAEELRGTNIQVNAIAPGAVRSRMWDEMRAAGNAGGQKLLEEIKHMDRTGGVPPERGAALAMFLASDRSKSLSGRLISAVHDKWEGMEARIPAIMSTEAGTLRRIPLD